MSKKCLLKAERIVHCSSPQCNHSVRLFADFKGSLSEFRCAECLPWLEFCESKQVVGQYTICSVCRSQYKVVKIQQVSFN